MPDTPVEPSGPSRYPAEMESRVAVLEQIARATTAGLEQVMRAVEANRTEMRTFQDSQRTETRASQDRLERRIDQLAAEQRADFRWLLGVMLGGFTTLLGAMGAMLAAMAHGFHWL